MVRMLGVDYDRSEKLLTVCITDKIDGSITVVHIEQLEDVVTEKQAIKLCKQFYKRFDCDKVVSDDLVINFR